MDPNKEVIETEQQQEGAVDQDDSSQSETTETQTEETQATETGEQEKTEEQQEKETTTEETTEGEVDDKGKEKTPEQKAKAREEFLKRQLEKKEKELAEAKAAAEPSPARQQETQRQAQEAYQQEIQEYVETLGVSPEQAAFLVRKQEAKARQIAASQVQPLTGTFHRTQFETIKKELASDPEILDFKTLEPEVDKLAREMEVKGQSFYLGNREAVKSWFLYTQGRKMKDLLKAAEERGRLKALKDKQVERDTGMPQTGAGGVNKGGYTQADKDLSASQDIPLETARKIRLRNETIAAARARQKK